MTMTVTTPAARDHQDHAVREWQAAFVDLLAQLPQCSSLIQEDCFHDRLYSAICDFSRHHRPLALAALSQSLDAIHECLRLAVPDPQQMHDEDQVDGRLAFFALRLHCLYEQLIDFDVSLAPVLSADGPPMDVIQAIIHHSVSAHANEIPSLYPEPHLIIGVMEYAARSPRFRQQVGLDSLDSAMLRACLHHNNVNIVRQTCVLVLEFIQPAASSPNRPSLALLLVPLLSTEPQPHAHLNATHRGLAAVELASTLVESNFALLADERPLLAPLATSPNHLLRRKWLGLARFPPSLTGMDHSAIFDALVSHGWISDAINLIHDVPDAGLVVPFAQRILAADPDSTSSVLASVAQWVLHAHPPSSAAVQSWLAETTGTDPDVRWPYHTLAKALANATSSRDAAQRLLDAICRTLVAHPTHERHAGECLLALKVFALADRWDSRKHDELVPTLESLAEGINEPCATLAAGLLDRIRVPDGTGDDVSAGRLESEDDEEVAVYEHESELQDLLATVHFYQHRRCDKEQEGMESNFMDCY